MQQQAGQPFYWRPQHERGPASRLGAMLQGSVGFIAMLMMAMPTG